jgi:hypothetical protein
MLMWLLNAAQQINQPQRMRKPEQHGHKPCSRSQTRISSKANITRIN